MLETRCMPIPFALYKDPWSCMKAVAAMARTKDWARQGVFPDDDRVLWEVCDDHVMLWYRERTEDERGTG